MTKEKKEKKKKEKKKKKKKLSEQKSEARKLFESKDPIIRLSQDMKDAALRMGILEARYLVDSYYTYQNVRIRAAHQVDRCDEEKEPTELLRWAHGNFDQIETDMKTALGTFAGQYATGEWLQSICGIANIMSAGFLTTFDIRERFITYCDCKDKDQDEKHGKGKRSMRPIGGSYKDGILRFRCTGRRGKGEEETEDDDNTPTEKKKDKSCKVVREVKPRYLRAGEGILVRPKTVGHWWNYAGLNPLITWEKGKVRPWNARAKVLCFKAGESFIKVQNRDADFYGKLFAERKAYETRKNQHGEYGPIALERAKKAVEDKKTTTVAYSHYKEGRLPPAHIVSRARRYAVKMFLSHFHDVSYRDYYGEAPPVPFVFSEHYKGQETHTHYIEPPYIESKAKGLRCLYGEM